MRAARRPVFQETSIVTNREEYVAVHSVLAAFYNVGSDVEPQPIEPSICDFLRLQNPKVHPSYLDDKARMWRSSPIAWFGACDTARQLAFIEWAKKWFGAMSHAQFEAHESRDAERFPV